MTHEVIKALHDVDIYEIAYCKKLFYGIGRHREEKGQGYALLEFGAIFICPRRLVELGSYSTLICPRDLSAISQVSVRCNGITRESVAAEPAFEQVADRVYDMLHAGYWTETARGGQGVPWGQPLLQLVARAAGIEEDDIGCSGDALIRAMGRGLSPLGLLEGPQRGMSRLEHLRTK